MRINAPIFDRGGHDLSTCAYYRGKGSCSFGCWEEPSCITDEPTEGWRIHRHRTANPHPTIRTKRHG